MAEVCWSSSAVILREGRWEPMKIEWEIFNLSETKCSGKQKERGVTQDSACYIYWKNVKSRFRFSELGESCDVIILGLYLKRTPVLPS